MNYLDQICNHEWDVIGYADIKCDSGERQKVDIVSYQVLPDHKNGGRVQVIRHNKNPYFDRSSYDNQEEFRTYTYWYWETNLENVILFVDRNDPDIGKCRTKGYYLKRQKKIDKILKDGGVWPPIVEKVQLTSEPSAEAINEFTTAFDKAIGKAKGMVGVKSTSEMFINEVKFTSEMFIKEGEAEVEVEDSFYFL